MTDVLSEIERQRRIEQARAWDKAEAELAERLAAKLDLELAHRDPVIELVKCTPSPMEAQHWLLFVAWCAEKNVRHCPAKPTTVAAYLLENRGAGHDMLLDTLPAIASQHDKHGLSNPTATYIVRTVLELSLDDKPPRSWKGHEQKAWASLPADIRFALSRRQRECDKEVRLRQQEAADLRKKLNEKNQQVPIEQSAEPHPAAPVGV